MVQRGKNIVNSSKESPTYSYNVRALHAVPVLCAHCAQTPPCGAQKLRCNRCCVVETQLEALFMP